MNVDADSCSGVVAQGGATRARDIFPMLDIYILKLHLLDDVHVICGIICYLLPMHLRDAGASIYIYSLCGRRLHFFLFMMLAIDFFSSVFFLSGRELRLRVRRGVLQHARWKPYRAFKLLFVRI